MQRVELRLHAGHWQLKTTLANMTVTPPSPFVCVDSQVVGWLRDQDFPTAMVAGPSPRPVIVLASEPTNPNLADVRRRGKIRELASAGC